MIQLTNLRKSYGTESNTHDILKGINLTIDNGEFVLITGKSGSGKSTLLNMLTGVDKPSSGEVIINNKSIHDLSEEEMAEWRGNNLGIVFQFFQLIPTLSVMENILLPMDLVNKLPADEREGKATELLKLVGLYNHRDKMPSELSGGEQQRVAIARSLANDVNLIVADEPTGNLDSQNADSIFDLLEDLRKQGKTIVMVTHEKEDLKGATRKVIIKDGEIIRDIPLQ